MGGERAATARGQGQRAREPAAAVGGAGRRYPGREAIVRGITFRGQRFRGRVLEDKKFTGGTRKNKSETNMFFL